MIKHLSAAHKDRIWRASHRNVCSSLPARRATKMIRRHRVCWCFSWSQRDPILWILWAVRCWEGSGNCIWSIKIKHVVVVMNLGNSSSAIWSSIPRLKCWGFTCMLEDGYMIYPLKQPWPLFGWDGMVLNIDPQIHENTRWNEIAGMNSGCVRCVLSMVGPGCLERAGRLALLWRAGWFLLLEVVDFFLELHDQYSQICRNNWTNCVFFFSFIIFN